VSCDRIPKALDLLLRDGLAASFHTLFRLTGSAWRQRESGCGRACQTWKWYSSSSGG
jgi:hypothetical protein